MREKKSNARTPKAVARSTPVHDDPSINEEGLLALVGYNCRQVTMVMGPRFAKRMAKLGIRRMEFAVLMLVRGDEQINQKRLAKIIHVAPSNLNLVLDRLESVGWLVRYRNPLDKRSQFVKLTPRGLRKCEIAEKAAIETENEATSALTDQERAELVRLLRKVHLHSEPGAAVN
ncbi:MAG: MarR family transcriptional regulator [Rhodocyclaceae bacterium]|nr:MAG: MarR family transcriptional regulator [Rhodocyclaceae bacterium]